MEPFLGRDQRNRDECEMLHKYAQDLFGKLHSLKID